MIRIVNVKHYKPSKDEILFMVDRTTPLGNPFYINFFEHETRDVVCDEYQIWFENMLKGDNQDFHNYLNFIYNKSLTNNIALGCHCLPQRCHAETIKKYLEERYKKELK